MHTYIHTYTHTHTYMHTHYLNSPRFRKYKHIIYFILLPFDTHVVFALWNTIAALSSVLPSLGALPLIFKLIRNLIYGSFNPDLVHKLF
jgi:accessory gene regulator protein AgrB